MHFIKMHGLGNDYVFLDMRHQTLADPAAFARAVSRPHLGVGSDGLMLICSSDRADFAMRAFNADGSEAQMCGNAARCVGKYLYERGITQKTQFTLDTLGGVRTLWLNVAGDKVESVKVDMGAPGLAPGDVGTQLPVERAIAYPLTAAGQHWAVTLVSMGNPHAVIFVTSGLDNLDLPAIGPAIEHHPLFPQRINVEFVQVLAPDHLRMRVWERGSGETQACGTGACAVLVAAHLNGLAGREAKVSLLGGDLFVAWNQADDHVTKTGPATIVFEGEWLLDT